MASTEESLPRRRFRARRFAVDAAATVLTAASTAAVAFVVAWWLLPASVEAPPEAVRVELLVLIRAVGFTWWWDWLAGVGLCALLGIAWFALAARTRRTRDWSSTAAALSWVMLGAALAGSTLLDLSRNAVLAVAPADAHHWWPSGLIIFGGLQFVVIGLALNWAFRSRRDP